jgi:hypothetical protein
MRTGNLIDDIMNFVSIMDKLSYDINLYNTYQNEKENKIMIIKLSIKYQDYIKPLINIFCQDMMKKHNIKLLIENEKIDDIYMVTIKYSFLINKL